MILAQTSQDSQVPVGPASPAPPASKKKVPWSVTVGKKISESLEDLEVFAALVWERWESLERTLRGGDCG